MWKSSIFSNIEVWEPVTLRKHLLYKIFFTDVSGEIVIKTQEKYKSKKKKKESNIIVFNTFLRLFRFVISSMFVLTLFFMDFLMDVRFVELGESGGGG